MKPTPIFVACGVMLLLAPSSHGAQFPYDRGGGPPPYPLQEFPPGYRDFGPGTYGDYPQPAPYPPYYPNQYPQSPALPPPPHYDRIPPRVSSGVVRLADQLTAQADEFLSAFSLDARRVPEGRQFLEDASRLRDAALRFRDLAASGAPPQVLVGEFQGVAASWGRLESRMARISRGQIGPNIATALQMGRTVEQIGRLLVF